MQETQETWVRSLGRGDCLEEGMAIHSSILVWRILWTQKPGGLLPIGRRELNMIAVAEHAHTGRGEWEKTA